MGQKKQQKGEHSKLEDKLRGLRSASGCYLFKDAKGTIVYVGKAKSLRSRVRSYFQASNTDSRYFLPFLRRLVRDVETLVTASEKEAAVLENELIKRHQPRFNVKLRDDKNFLCLRLDGNEAWPRLRTVRKPATDGARYFGPFHSSTSARRTLQLVNKHFQLRTCTDSDMKTRIRPCLQYQIKRCPAPCVYDVDAAWYGEQVRSVELFLDARHDELSATLASRMQQASSELNFELAALYRDQLKAVQVVVEKQRIVTVSKLDQDVIAFHREGDMVELVLLVVRKGHVVDSQSFSLPRSQLPDQELVAGFIGQYYNSESRLTTLPDELVLPLRPEAAQGLAEWLSDERGRKVRVVVPQKGDRKKLLGLAQENAEHAFREKRRADEEIEERLEQLRLKLRLPVLPRVIECCDISHLGGGDTVGSIVCLRDGQPDKSRYRLFKVKTTDRGDDYAAIHEVLARRFRRGRDAQPEADSNWELPDLLVVDGGRGQLSVALTAARDLGLHDLAIVGLAKERETVGGEKLVDRVFLPGQKNGISLKPTSPSLYILARARDEAHRFANHGRKKRGKRRGLRSELDDIPGVGPVARRALLRKIGSLPALKQASDEEILAVAGVTKRHLTALRKVIPAPPLAPRAETDPAADA